MNPKYALELCGLTILNNKIRDRLRKYAVENINLKIPFHGRSMIFGKPEAGKTIIKEAITGYKKYDKMVKVNAELKEIPLTVKHRKWEITDYRKEFCPIDHSLFVIVDEYIDSAIGFILGLPNGVLIFAGNDGYKHIKEFDNIAFLHKGKILFQGNWEKFKQRIPSMYDNARDDSDLEDILSRLSHEHHIDIKQRPSMPF